MDSKVMPQMPQPGQGDPIRDNMSILNPIDAAGLKQTGDFESAQTVNDVMRLLGIDPEGPKEQLLEFGIKQVENADMLKKMQNIGGQGSPQGMPPQGASPQGMPPQQGGSPQLPPQAGGLESLLG